MEILDGIDQMLKHSGISRAEIARQLDRSPASIYNMFSRGTDVYTDTLVRIAAIAGYRVYLVSEAEALEITERGGEDSDTDKRTADKS